jgi:hypothetical protein
VDSPDTSPDTPTRVRRRRSTRPKTLAERIAKAFSITGVKPSVRNQRIAIVATVIVMGLYLLVGPILQRYFPSAPPTPLTDEKRRRAERESPLADE